MDKFDRFLEDIIIKTEGDNIRWEPVLPSSYYEYIFQSQFAYQAFSGTYDNGKHKYKLIFVNKKIPGLHEEWDMTVERHYSEVLVFDGNTLIITLNNNYVDDENLTRLGMLIEDNNSSARELLASFE
ncbi:MAG: hypothetical protein P4L44_10825 [Oryzomonas sp.]|uniref:hypothetical protein n=1 Tax=Oryzomonas sp. TaxID=2855186 RepID=UPI0028437E24|nr:hypothetical protein [Oryzomonas sp.]MDR3580445.1 hypothetical protein [Oryzomonas sp.]